MWAVSRRTGLFIVSYAPLAAMFAVFKWPSGWPVRDLLLLVAAMADIAALALLIPSVITARHGARIWVVLGSVPAIGLLMIAIFSGWLRPFALSAPAHNVRSDCGARDFLHRPRGDDRRADVS